MKHRKPEEIYTKFKNFSKNYTANSRVSVIMEIKYLNGIIGRGGSRVGHFKDYSRNCHTFRNATTKSIVASIKSTLLIRLG